MNFKEFARDVAIFGFTARALFGGETNNVNAKAEDVSSVAGLPTHIRQADDGTEIGALATDTAENSFAPESEQGPVRTFMVPWITKPVNTRELNYVPMLAQESFASWQYNSEFVAQYVASENERMSNVELAKPDSLDAMFRQRLAIEYAYLIEQEKFIDSEQSQTYGEYFASVGVEPEQLEAWIANLETPELLPDILFPVASEGPEVFARPVLTVLELNPEAALSQQMGFSLPPENRVDTWGRYMGPLVEYIKDPDSEYPVMVLELTVDSDTREIQFSYFINPEHEDMPTLSEYLASRAMEAFSFGVRYQSTPNSVSALNTYYQEHPYAKDQANDPVNQGIFVPSS